MFTPDKIFLFFLCNGATGTCYYEDDNGNIQEASILSGQRLALKKAPMGWLDSAVSFGRNTRYWGINRTFTEPFRFVGDGAKIIRTLFYSGRGVESPIEIKVFRWNPAPADGGANYELFYSGRLDLNKIDDALSESVGVNVMEGGIVQLLKAYENTTFQIPCDGSIEENVKINYDGLLFEDTLYYQFPNFTAGYPGTAIMPSAYINNEGDSIGVVHGDPSYEQNTGTDYYKTSANYLFTSVSAITVRIKGQITVKPTNDHPANFGLYLTTSNSQPIGVGKVSYGRNLVPQTNGDYPLSYDVPAQVRLRQQTVFNFDVTVNLAANENLFMVFFNEFQDYPISVVYGSFEMSYQSQYPSTRAWGITAWDLFKLLIKNINKVSSDAAQTFSYLANSDLLKSKLNMVVSSGDALRASGDANYNKFYNAVQNNPNYPNINEYFSYGPVIKTSLADFFDSFGAIFCAALSNQKLEGEGESVFMEPMDYVFDRSAVDFDLGEVSAPRLSVWEDVLFNRFKIGYPAQQYDQKAGKYETNTTAEWNMPMKTNTRSLERISKYRADPYGIEKLRASSGGTSITKNDSDNSVFITNVDYDTYIYDYFKASFVSTVPDPDSSGTTNIQLTTSSAGQNMSLPTIDGNYFSPRIDPSIFFFNQPGLSTTYIAAVSFAGYLLGQPGDTLTVSMWVNGVVINSWTYTISSGQVNFSETYNYSKTWVYRDVVFFTCETSVTAEATFASFSMNVGGGYFQAALYGAISIAAGQSRRLVSLPSITATEVNDLPVVSSGFSYFVFNQILINNNFDLAVYLDGYIQGGGAESLSFDVFVNGELKTTLIRYGSISRTAYYLTYGININFNLGDIVFILPSTTNVTASIVTARLTVTSTQIKAYSLLRKKYDAISGVSPLPVNPSTLQHDSSIAGAPYNIEELSPRRMLQANGSLIKGAVFNLVPEEIKFQSLSKNQYQSTTLAGVTYAENADFNIGSLPAIYFYPYILDFKTKVPFTFAQLQSYAAKGHIKLSFNGVDLYVFILQMTQKPGLNEPQEWKGILSPATNLADIANLNFDGLQLLNLNNLSMYISALCPFHTVPLNYSRPAKYHTTWMDQDWFINTINQWTSKNNYFAPVQKDDYYPAQVFTKGLSPVIATVYQCDGKVVETIEATQKYSNSLPPDVLMFEIEPDFTGYASGQYYIVWQASNGGNAQYAITEGFDLQDDHPNTLLFEYRNTDNKQSVVFDTGYYPSFRVPGFIYGFQPKSVSAPYVDQPQDIELLNAIPFETYKLFIGGPDNQGVPDWVQKKVARIMLLNDVKIEGKGFSAELNAEWEETFNPGQPRRYWTLEIRPTENSDGLTIAEPTVDDNNIIVTMDANVFGPNAQNEGDQEPNIVETIITG